MKLAVARSSSAPVASADEAADWAAARLARGETPAYVADSLHRRGWTPELANYFVAQVADRLRPALYGRARRITLASCTWLGGSVGALLGVHAISGTWSNQGPLLVGWAVVACNALRLLGGLVNLSRWRPARRPGREERARAGDAQWVESEVYVPGKLSALAALDWQTLGLEPGAPREHISRAYKALAMTWHPDRHGDSAEIRERAEQRMKRINAAYARLNSGD
jgi:hypothetical protein